MLGEKWVAQGIMMENKVDGYKNLLFSKKGVMSKAYRAAPFPFTLSGDMWAAVQPHDERAGTGTATAVQGSRFDTSTGRGSYTALDPGICPLWPAKSHAIHSPILAWPR